MAAWFFARKPSQPYVPGLEQRKVREDLARQIRTWLEWDDDAILVSGPLDGGLGGELGTLLSNSDPKDELFNDSFHELQHYFSDADVRKKDPQYAELTRSQMVRRAEQLEAQ